MISLNCRGLAVLDWSDPIDWRDSVHWNNGRQDACIHCSKPALLLDDLGRPAHKVCAEGAIADLAALLAQRKAAQREEVAEAA